MVEAFPDSLPQPSDHASTTGPAAVTSSVEVKSMRTAQIKRKQWTPTGTINGPIVCSHCGLIQREHINSLFCPEWRLRQLDGDR